MVKFQDLRSTFNMGGPQTKYELQDFYRAKDSPAEIQIGNNPDVLRRVETKYYTDLYWGLETKMIPYMVKFLQEEEEKFNLQLNARS